ncbi:pentatricopeptide repeat-containing protein At1g11290, chloroplastic [Selaginella moellendorffii]|uniref:pentatricopeptide repeat-containing protein At1g11290, chloroplastic n=1 Tax=Selaginella moellendorffii TaxID=88036 RepID=UPI000D1C23D4|nr:pentatricopeptide repeat-containing protein At1g11290, chloroplastic [Selaginella moellendorffii]|eukprot:XP_002984062.2 pentatricopeptide repeat-containing protein At1g11290, chloroplastic [Selaginella moellendorffii]
MLKRGARVLDRSEEARSYSALEAAVRRCLATRDLEEGRRVHGAIAARGLDRDRYLGNLLVEMYGKCGRVGDALAVFHGIHAPNVFSWNNILTAFSRNGAEQRAIEFLSRMQQLGDRPDRITFLLVLDCCASCKDGTRGKQFHCLIEESSEDYHVSLKNALIHMYSSCGFLGRAKEIFDGCGERDVVTWSSMIAAYCENRHYDRAMKMLQGMDLLGEKPSFVTHITLLDACAGLGQYEKGVMIHRRILEAGHEMELNLANANGRSLEALKIFQRLDFEGLKPSKVTFLSLLEACAGSSSPDHGKFLHDRVEAAGFLSDTVLANALINTHGRSGSLARAREVFDRIQRRSVSSWSTMIEVYAQRGESTKALELFTSMILEGFDPSDVTFISVLGACSHAGLASKSWEYFRMVVEDFGIDPVDEHYGCVIDVFGRLGWLDEAIAFAANSAIHSSSVAWTMLLAAAKTHGDEERGGQAARRAVEINPDAQTCYILLSNLYTEPANASGFALVV